MKIKFLTAAAMLDQNCRPITYYKDDIIEVDDSIGNDLIKYDIAVLVTEKIIELPEVFAITPQIKRKNNPLEKSE
jgi:hypothetical protein